METLATKSFGLELVEHVPALRRYASHLTRTPDQADDLVQDCIARALSRAHLYEPGTNLHAWLFAMIRNIAFSQSRKEKHRLDYASGRMSLAPRAAAPRQPDMVSLNESLQLVKRLSPSQRQAVTLLGMLELSYEEASHCSGLEIGTLKSRLSRGRARLRTLSGVTSDETASLAA